MGLMCSHPWQITCFFSPYHHVGNLKYMHLTFETIVFVVGEFDLHLIISFQIRFNLYGWDNKDEGMENLNAL